MIQSTFIPALLIALLAAGSYWAGDHNRNNAWLAKQAAQQQAATQQLQAQQDRGDALTGALISAESHIDQLTKDAHRDIKTTTTGRACLGSAAIRVLSTAAGVSTQLAPTGSPAAADGAIASTADNAGSTAPGDEFATDTQIGDWASDAAAQYETCRTRLDKLIDWYSAP
ncbi:MAG: hypothetical protein PHH58_03245 [Rhodoferax sp.]|nr:hypothetical protein [Rhodoferax sp.]